jgi:hypothetical protein
LFETHGIWTEIIIINIGNLYPLVREGQGELGPYQVRPVQKYFLEQLRKRMEATRVSQATVPFVLLVDPKLCPTRADFQMDKKDEYKYYVIGGNHSACARMDLSRANPHLDSLRRIQAWVVAGVTVQEARTLAWGHNVDNEFRSKMTTIQRINYIHMRYLENEMKGDMAFKMEVAAEIQLRNWGVEDDKKVLNANDNLFQLAFKKGEIWDGVAKVLAKWDEGEIKGQKQVKIPKAGPKGKGKAVAESRPPHRT